MNALSKMNEVPLTMGSDEIASLVESRHDNVKRTIERLAEKSVIQLPPLEDVKNSQGQTVSIYKLCKRDSYVVVAQLSPEFTARLVDRWQELEADASNPVKALSDPFMLRQVLLGYTEKVIALEGKVADLEPKAVALDRFANHEGKHVLRTATKILGLQENKLKTWLLMGKWYYRDHSSRLCAYADKITAGFLDTVPVEIQRTEGIQVVQQPVITQKGLSKLAVLLARDGLIPKAAA